MQLDIVLVEGARSRFLPPDKDASDWTEQLRAVQTTTLARAGVTESELDAQYLGAGAMDALGGGAIDEALAAAHTVFTGTGAGIRVLGEAVEALRLEKAEAILITGSDAGKLRFKGTAASGTDANDTSVLARLSELLKTDLKQQSHYLADRYGLTRIQTAEYSYLSRRRARRAQERLSAEMVENVYLESSVVRRQRTSPKEEVKLQAYQDVATEATGTVSVLLTTAQWAFEQKLKPLAYLHTYAQRTRGTETDSVGAVHMEEVVRTAGLDLEEIDLFEIEELTALHYLALEKALRIPRRISNVNGGSLAFGYAPAASGLRSLLSCGYEMRIRPARYGLVHAPVENGGSVTILLESVRARRSQSPER